jgi:predicted TIM-barrel fold metal-dependent hydrolase
MNRRDFLRASAGALALSACRTTGDGEAEPILDIHQHLNYGGTRDKDWNVTAPGRSDEALLAHQRAMGATRTILLPAGRPLRQGSTLQGKANGLDTTCTGNEAAYRLAREHPDLFSFGANEVPDLPDTIETVEKYLKLGAVVIGEQKFGVECDAPEMRRLYSLAGAYRVPILMHWQFKSYNHGFERFHRMLEKYPHVAFIGHAQTWWANIDRGHQDQTVLYPKTPVTPGGLTDRYLSDYPNMYADLSAGSGRNALSRDEEHARDFLRRHQDKLMFGSDCPDTTAAPPECIGASTIALIRKLSPSKEIERRLLYGNASRLFRLAR